MIYQSILLKVSKLLTFLMNVCKPYKILYFIIIIIIDPFTHSFIFIPNPIIHFIDLCPHHLEFSLVFQLVGFIIHKLPTMLLNQMLLIFIMLKFSLLIAFTVSQLLSPLNLLFSINVGLSKFLLLLISLTYQRFLLCRLFVKISK
jgi:hypothetical protein